MAADKISVQGKEVTIITHCATDYISLTDMVRGAENGLALIEKWLRNKNTIEFLGIWEEINNPTFNSPEFEGIKSQAGLNRFVLSVKQWVERTCSKGILAKAGRYGGTYAHRDIAFEFAAWLSPKFKLYLIKEFQRLKEAETLKLKVGWDIQRTLAKVNYRIHTDAIKESLIPPELSKSQIDAVYASEADILNVALFGKTAAQWRQKNPGLRGNIRDFATIEQLVVLSNLESVNSVFIRQGLPQNQRLQQLNKTAISQMLSLAGAGGIKKLDSREPAAEYAVLGGDKKGAELVGRQPQHPGRPARGGRLPDGSYPVRRP